MTTNHTPRSSTDNQEIGREPGGFGTRLLTKDKRAALEQRRDSGHPLATVGARLRLRVDDNRRANRQAAGRARDAGQARGPGVPVRLTQTGVAGAGGGRSGSVARPAEYRGTTAQVAGLWPWSVGAGAPLIGTPLGIHLDTGEPVCFDPMNWFTRAGVLSAPILFVLGLNGFGKSSLVRRLVLGAIAQGIKPLVLADVKPDYRDTIESVGGQVIDVGYGHGTLNPLDPGVMGQAVARLEAGGFETEAEGLRSEIRARHTNLLGGLIELVRGGRIADFEDTIISTALRALMLPESDGGRGFTPDNPPIIADLAEVIAAGGSELHLDAAAQNPEQYQAAIIPLRRSLRALTQGNFGRVFNGHTTTPLDLDSVAVCVDVSHIARNDKKLKAAVMLASWSSGFGAIEALNLLADVGLEPQRYFQVVMDELWQVLGLGESMVERVDELTRLQRAIATELIMISHTVKDLQSLGSDAAMGKALGFLERARAKILGALPPEEIRRLDTVVPFTRAEAAMVTGWSSPQALTCEPITRGGATALPPGVGKFLLKVAEDRSPGVPFRLELTAIEQQTGIHATSRLFEGFGRREEREDHRGTS